MSMLRNKVAAVASAFALAATATLAGAAPAFALDGPQCGDVITVDTVLTADLVCDGSSDGLVIGADDVTLDLRGHSISGPGAYATPYAAVRAATRNGVTVTRGTVTGFQAGVVLDQSWGATVSKLTVSANDQGINLAGGGQHVIAKNTVSANGRDGVRLGLSMNNTVTQNTVSDNTWGISVADGSQGNLVSRNVVAGSHSNGLVAFGAAVGTSFSQNTVSGSWSDGIVVSGDTTGSTLSQNSSSANGGTGIRAANSLVVKNTAVSNAGQGIVATGASTDGGGNKAAGNLVEPQCSGVVCTAP